MKSYKVTIQPCTVRGKKSWLVRWHDQEKIRRQYFADKNGAKSKAAELRCEQTGINQFWSALTQAEREILFTVWRESERRGIDLMAMVTRVDVAPASKSPACSVVLKELVEVKTNAGLDGDYIDSINKSVKALIKGKEALPMSLVKFEDVEKFIDSFNVESRSTKRARLATWFKFGVRRGYCLQNLCDRLEPTKVVKGPPRIFTLNEIKSALKWLAENPRAFGWFILSTFAGLRPEEAAQTTWKMINFKEGWIRVEAQTSKVSQRRVVYPITAAMDWLKRAHDLNAELPLTTKQLQNERNGLRDALGLNAWPQDVTRHTACSMWLAHVGHAEKVALQLGHSEKVLHRNYKALVTRTEAKEFWEINNPP